MSYSKTCEDCQYYNGMCIAYGGAVGYGEEVKDTTIAENCKDYRISLAKYEELD